MCHMECCKNQGVIRQLDVYKGLGDLTNPQVLVCNATMPVVCESNHFITSRTFLHPNRQLPFHVLLYVKKGTFYVTEKEVDYVIPEGSIFFMKAGLRHYGKYPIEAGTEWHFIHFYLNQEVDKIEEFQEEVKPITPCVKLESYLKLPKQLYDMQESEIVGKIEDFTEFAQSGDPYKAWYLNQKTAEILQDIALWDKRIHSEVLLSDQVAQYLMKQLDHNYSADAVAKEFYLSYKYLAATFKREKGVTMQQFHNTMRMQRAAHSLTSTGSTVSEISQRLGFKDALYFSRCFHRQFGMSPREYRQVHAVVKV